MTLSVDMVAMCPVVAIAPFPECSSNSASKQTNKVQASQWNDFPMIVETNKTLKWKPAVEVVSAGRAGVCTHRTLQTDKRAQRKLRHVQLCKDRSIYKALQVA